MMFFNSISSSYASYFKSNMRHISENKLKTISNRRFNQTDKKNLLSNANNKLKKYKIEYYIIFKNELSLFKNL